MSLASGVAASMLALGCCKFSPGVHVRTGQREYRAGQDVVVILENGGGSSLELAPGCYDRLERYENGAWMPVVRVFDPAGEPRCTDGPTIVPCPPLCEESFKVLASCSTLSYRWRLLETLRPGTYRLKVNDHGSGRLATNPFTVSAEHGAN